MEKRRARAVDKNPVFESADASRVLEFSELNWRIASSLKRIVFSDKNWFRRSPDDAAPFRSRVVGLLD